MKITTISQYGEIRFFSCVADYRDANPDMHNGIIVRGTPRTHADAIAQLRANSAPNKRLAREALAVWLGEIVPGYEYSSWQGGRCTCRRCER